MRQKSRLVLYAALTFLAGLIIGGFLEIPSGSHGDLNADIGKLNRYKREVLSSRSLAILERLNSDEDFKNQTLSSLAIVAAHAGEFRVNAALSIEALAGEPSLEKTALLMQQIQSLSQNAAAGAFTALSAVDAALQGEELDLEEPLSRALLSFMVLNRNAHVAKQYVTEVDEFLKGKDPDYYTHLVFARDQWISYGAMDAYLNGDAKSMVYWSHFSTLMPQKEATAYYQSLSQTDRADLSAAAAVQREILLADNAGETNWKIPLSYVLQADYKSSPITESAFMGVQEQRLGFLSHLSHFSTNRMSRGDSFMGSRVVDQMEEALNAYL